MKPRPVKQSETPEYPTRRQLLKGGAAIVLFGPMVGCERTTAGVVGPPTDDPMLLGEVGPPIIGEQHRKNRPLVAPLFDHGEGRGVIGCEVAVPPVFISEEEALLIIREELAKAGVVLGPGRELPGVEVTLGGGPPYAPENNVESRPITASLDGESENPHIGVQMISQMDGTLLFREFNHESVFDYDGKIVVSCYASAFREQLNEDLVIGLFYDPMCTFENQQDRDYHENYADALEKSKDELRLQAVDFVTWLEEQGIL